MNIGAILVGLALLILVVPFVVSPFFDERRRKPGYKENKDAEDIQRREHVFTALRDLDFDYQTEKVTSEDYNSLRAQLMAEAAKLIQEGQRDQVRDAVNDDDLEALIRARRDALALISQCARCGVSLLPKDRYCPSCGELVGSRCDSCGKPLDIGDRFCSSCGTSLEK